MKRKIIYILLAAFLSAGMYGAGSGTGRTAIAENEEKFLSQYLWREVVTLPRDKRPKIGLVLGGGGARGLAHIGVLRVLEEEGFPIDVIAGTSVGSLVGAMYSAGVPIDELEKISKILGENARNDIGTITKSTFRSILWSILNFRSIYDIIFYRKLRSVESMEQYITKYLGEKQFYDLNIPFACVATDLKTGEKIIFREGEVAIAVRASATIPGFFDPVEYRQRKLVDGGLVDNIPTDLAKMLGADIIIAIDVSSDFTKYSTSNIALMLNQAIYIQGDLLAREELKGADIVINPHVKEVAAYELWRSPECIDAGTIAARKMMPRLKKIVMDEIFKKMLQEK